MDDWAVGGLGWRRAVTAHAPQLVTDSFFCVPPANSALRAPQAVVEKSHAPRLGCASGGFARRVVKSRILRSLCEGAEKSLCAQLLDCAVRKFVLNKC